MGRRYRGERGGTSWVPVGLAALALALTACGGGSTGTGGGAACAAAVRLHGEWLLGHGIAGLRSRLPALGGRVEVVMPPCNDTNGPRERSRTIVLRRFAGAAPAIALAQVARRRTAALYLGEGYLPALPSHPLHRAFYGTDARPVATRGRRCRPAAPETGRIDTAGAADGVALARRTWVVDARTRLDVPHAHGMPRLAPRMRVRVAGLRCTGARTVWVARRVSAV